MKACRTTTRFPITKQKGLRAPDRLLLLVRRSAAQDPAPPVQEDQSRFHAPADAQVSAVHVGVAPAGQDHQVPRHRQAAPAPEHDVVQVQPDPVGAIGASALEAIAAHHPPADTGGRLARARGPVLARLGPMCAPGLRPHQRDLGLPGVLLLDNLGGRPGDIGELRLPHLAVAKRDVVLLARSFAGGRGVGRPTPHLLLDPSPLGPVLLGAQVYEICHRPGGLLHLPGRGVEATLDDHPVHLLVRFPPCGPEGPVPTTDLADIHHFSECPWIPVERIVNTRIS